ncbi:MAG: hypothetical protein H7Z12_18795 [Rhodospirillaceae bacterium]|nr:hypothetical protein [Rhodospirillales bacterium]
MSLATLIAASSARNLPPAIAAFARRLAEDVPGALAVLFYGSCLREPALDGILDFYVLTERPRTLADRVLVPTVHFVESDGLRAKVAVIPVAAFTRAMRLGALSTHLWARFCQPVALAWARHDGAAAAVRQALVQAADTAAWWAERLAPPHCSVEETWQGLFRHTYAAELRAEADDRPYRLVAAAPDYWHQLAALTFTAPLPAERGAAARAWARRRWLGKPLAAARLVKGAFTFAGGANYLAWKIERHTGYRLRLTPWQQRHPILAAVPLLLRLRRAGIIR